jgi:hypothetical protein
MEFNHDSSWDNFEKIFNSRPTFKDGWNKIIDFHEAITKKPYWTELRNVNFENELTEMKEWIEGVLTNYPITNDTIALWIGLIKILDENENETYALYLVGSNTFDKNDIEWATEPTYLPENRYAIFEALDKIEQLTKNNGDNDFYFLDWILPLSFSALLIDECIRTNLNKSLFLTHNKEISIAVGFDSGDYYNLTTIKK